MEKIKAPDVVLVSSINWNLEAFCQNNTGGAWQAVYRRSDIPWLPDELVEQIKDRIFKLSYREPEGHLIKLLREILSAVEQKQ